MTTPMWEHRCDRCVFLGQFLEAVDLWICPDAEEGGGMHSLIARYGNAIEQYTASHPPYCFAEGYEALRWEKEVMKRALEEGVIREKTG